MNQEIFFNSGQNRLFSICTTPDQQKIEAGLVFVHAAYSNRLGPHRMFVELANRLKYHNIASLRFDMQGCGDSTGKAAGNDIKPDIEDLLNAIKFFDSEYNLPKIFLLGISKGARVSITALADHTVPVDGAVLLSTPFFSSKAAAKKFADRLKEYLYKFRNPDSLKKLLSGDANIRQILKTLAFALSSTKRHHRSNNSFATVCPLFFIYGSKDPIAKNSALHYKRICQKYKIPSKTLEIKDANHSFFHYRWKEQIIEMTEKWLIKNIINGEKDGNLF